MRRAMTSAVHDVSRRSLLAAGAGAAVVWMSRHARAAALGLPLRDAWFWDMVGAVERRPPVGGPSAGLIDHSVFGVEAHRAGRVNPSQSPPSVSDFYVKAVLGPDAAASSGWDVGLVWRTSAEMDALWWSISADGTWSLRSATWAYSTSSAESIGSGALCTPVAPPVTLQAVVFGSQLACSVNNSEVVVAALPERRTDGQVGILANALQEHLSPTGSTPYDGLTLWALESTDVDGASLRPASTVCGG